MAVYTTHEQYEYQGTAFDHIAVYSVHPTSYPPPPEGGPHTKPNPPKQATLEKTDVGWKFVYVSRATGKKTESASG